MSDSSFPETDIEKKRDDNAWGRLTLDRVLEVEANHRLYAENRDPDTCDKILAAFRAKQDRTLTVDELFQITRSYRQRFGELRALDFVIEWNGQRKGSAFTLRNP